MNKYLPVILGTAFFFAAGTAAYAGPYGNYKRPNGTTAKVWSCGGKMCAKVTNDGFNMFLTGLKKSGKGVWKGDMKHPKMGTLFTFNGTAKQIGSNKLHVKGCMIGGSFCDAETWTKK